MSVATLNLATLRRWGGIGVPTTPRSVKICMQPSATVCPSANVMQAAARAGVLLGSCRRPALLANGFETEGFQVQKFACMRQRSGVGRDSIPVIPVGYEPDTSPVSASLGERADQGADG